MAHFKVELCRVEGIYSLVWQLWRRRSLNKKNRFVGTARALSVSDVHIHLQCTGIEAIILYYIIISLPCRKCIGV